jgi:polyhydroxybutyrate depolymerase
MTTTKEAIRIAAGAYHAGVRRLAVLLLFGLAACRRHHDPTCASRAHPGETVSCSVPRWEERGFTMEVPASWDGKSALPLIVALHGGGGNRTSALSVTCPGGNLQDPGCLGERAKAAGFAIVVPDGTGTPLLKNVRTWSSGGGANGFQCTSGEACKKGVDDVAYFDALLGEVGRLVRVDPRRVHVTGLSNGGAMTHRLACERSAKIASIASVGGGNQFAAAGGACAVKVPVLEIHGTSDPCWTYETSARACIDEPNGVKVGVAETMEGWRVRNGCTAETETTPMPDRDPTDGLHAERIRWKGCAADTELLRIEGGGHTWPSGDRYSSESRIGKVTRDFGSEVVLDFFRAHPR